MIVVMRRNAADTEPLASGLDGRCMRERWRSFLPQMWKLRQPVATDVLQVPSSADRPNFRSGLIHITERIFRFEHFATKLLHLQDVKMKSLLSIYSRGWSARSVRSAKMTKSATGGACFALLALLIIHVQVTAASWW